MKACTKYQRLGPSDFRQEDFLTFSPLWIYVEQVTPGVGPFFKPRAIL